MPLLDVVTTIASAHPWRLDIASLAAIITGAGTGVLAFFTWRVAKQTSALAEETKTLAVETGEDVRAEWRPVLVPGDKLTVSYKDGDNLASCQTALLNAGRGPALNIEVQFTSGSWVETIASDAVRVGPIRQDAYAPLLVPGMLYRDAGGNDAARLHYGLAATYEDLGGRKHRTLIWWVDPDDGRRGVPHLHGGENAPPPTRHSLDLVVARVEVDPSTEMGPVVMPAFEGSGSPWAAGGD